jgi:ankyrin repeat protein
LTHPQEEAQRRIGKRRGIHYYASDGNSELVELHILADANALDAQSYSSGTDALLSFYQATHRHTPVLFEALNKIGVLMNLIEWGVDLEARNELGETALYLTALQGNHTAMRMLIKAGARVNAQTK